MFWVVQEDLYCENRRYDLVSVLERFDLPYQLVSVASNSITPEIEYDGKIITNGSIMLSKIAVERGWKPGSLLNDNFNYEMWYPIFKEFLLNKNAVFTTLGEASISKPMFIRPVLDNKVFNGRVYTHTEFETLRSGPTSPKLETQILISTPKTIGMEHRHYIVDGKVVTSSRYKLGKTPNQQEGADQNVLDFVAKIIKIWTPAKAFVLDTYTAGNEIGIVEMGCICNAGLYQADLQKLVIALEEMEN